MPIDARTRSLVEAAVTAAGAEIWDLSLSGPVGRRLLRLYIDAPGGVDIEHCSRVSRTLRPMLDASPALADVDLEVSSPGAERLLRGAADYRGHVGFRVNVRFRPADEGSGAETVVEGTLAEVGDDELVVAAAGREVRVPIASLVAARLAVAIGGDDRPEHRGKRR